eukprot:TRINITY_DN2193_c0_g1_i1.p2 TRINITY_DN2193_c0_g1~~TRINITY_DN2193_c0_g1_i1.p2  ORF type:complete len:109 (+),score=6.53 TRINITY_DN2193_c0_g1_i1:45-329(+)
MSASGSEKIVFGATWCPHTRNAVSALGGHYEVAGGAFSAKDPSARVRYIDCEASKKNASICRAQNIRAYPTFMSCSNGACSEASPGSFGINTQL